MFLLELVVGEEANDMRHFAILGRVKCDRMRAAKEIADTIQRGRVVYASREHGLVFYGALEDEMDQ